MVNTYFVTNHYVRNILLMMIDNPVGLSGYEIGKCGNTSETTFPYNW